MKRLFSKEVMIGLTVLIALLVIFFGIEYLKGINVFKAANYYYATFTDVDGLAQSAPVTLNGYKVGLVREIEYQYDNPGHIQVEMSLNKNLRVPRGSRAVLVTGLLGTATIELELAHNNDYHTVGSELVGVNKKGMMDAVTEEMLPSVATLIPRVDSLLVAVTAIATDPALRNSIRSLDDVMVNLRNSSAQLSAVMNTMPGIASNASSTMSNVNQFSAQLLDISRDLNEVAAKVRVMPIDSTMRNINEITANLNQLTAQINSDQSTLGLLMRDPALYNNLNNSAAHIDSILLDLQRQPKRYIPSIKIF